MASIQNELIIFSCRALKCFISKLEIKLNEQKKKNDLKINEILMHKTRK